MAVFPATFFSILSVSKKKKRFNKSVLELGRQRLWALNTVNTLNTLNALHTLNILNTRFVALNTLNTLNTRGVAGRGWCRQVLQAQAGAAGGQVVVQGGRLRRQVA